MKGKLYEIDDNGDAKVTGILSVRDGVAVCDPASEDYADACRSIMESEIFSPHDDDKVFPIVAGDGELFLEFMPLFYSGTRVRAEVQEEAAPDETAEKELGLVVAREEDELSVGTDVEAEHEETYASLAQFVKANGKLPNKRQFFQMIAEDHLGEDGQYYAKLAKIGL